MPRDDIGTATRVTASLGSATGARATSNSGRWQRGLLLCAQNRPSKSAITQGQGPPCKICGQTGTADVYGGSMRNRDRSAQRGMGTPWNNSTITLTSCGGNTPTPEQNFHRGKDAGRLEGGIDEATWAETQLTYCEAKHGDQATFHEIQESGTGSSWSAMIRSAGKSEVSSVISRTVQPSVRAWRWPHSPTVSHSVFGLWFRALILCSDPVVLS